jgi:hypothetical protein
MNVLRKKIALYKSYNSNDLPNDYTRVDYLENPLGSYIDLNIKATPNTNVHYKYKVLEKQKFSCYLGSPEGFLFPSVRGENSLIQFVAVNSGNASSLITVPHSNDGFYEFKAFVDDKIIVNEEEYLVEKGTETESTYNLRLFDWQVGSYHQISTQTCFVKIYESDVLVCNLIPCYRKIDSVVGFYDTVSATFFTNQGTGEFTYGYL